MAQPIEKWIEELNTEIAALVDEIRDRSMELQQNDPVITELFRRHGEKLGALTYLQNKHSQEEPPKKKRKRKSTKALVDQKRKKDK
jgi:hypothetical protein